MAFLTFWRLSFLNRQRHRIEIWNDSAAARLSLSLDNRICHSVSLQWSQLVCLAGLQQFCIYLAIVLRERPVLHIEKSHIPRIKWWVEGEDVSHGIKVYKLDVPGRSLDQEVEVYEQGIFNPGKALVTVMSSLCGIMIDQISTIFSVTIVKQSLFFSS